MPMSKPHVIGHIYPWLNYDASCRPRRTSFVDLRCQIKLHETIVSLVEVVSDQERRIRPKTKLYDTAQWCGFGEIHQIPQCECGGDGLMDCESDFVLCFFRLAWF